MTTAYDGPESTPIQSPDLPKERPPGVPRFYDEHELRDHIARSPKVLPSVDARPAAAAIEVRVPPMIGFADVVVVDRGGSISIVECKLRKNREHHGSVVGQLFSYAAGLCGLRYDKFRDRFEARGASLTSPFQGDASWDKERFAQDVERSLAAGGFHLIVAVDEVSPALGVIYSFVTERMPDVDLQLLEFDTSQGPPLKRPEDLIEVIRSVSVAAGDAAEALLIWTKTEPRLDFAVKGFDGVISARDTVCRIKRHQELRVSLDKIARQLGPHGEDRVVPLRRGLEGMDFELHQGKASLSLDSLDVEEFLDLVRPVVAELAPPAAQ